MSLVYEERFSDSPYVESVTHGRTLSDGSAIRPAESHWHMVFVRHRGGVLHLVVGPLTTSGVATWQEGGEILWIKFKLGVFMPQLPVTNFLNGETQLPAAASQSFWLGGSAWDIPDFENAESLVNRLVRGGVLECDPVVKAVVQGQAHDKADRTVRHRFLRATGLTQGQIHQLERAQRASALLQQGKSILDTIDEAGYSDQPHLTRALKRWIGYTPAQLVHANP